MPVPPKRDPLRKKYSDISLLGAITSGAADEAEAALDGTGVSVRFEVFGLTAGKIVRAVAELTADPASEQVAMSQEVKDFAKRLKAIHAQAGKFFDLGADVDAEYTALRNLVVDGTDVGNNLRETLAFSAGLKTIIAAYSDERRFRFEVSRSGVDPNKDMNILIRIVNNLSEYETLAEFERNQVSRRGRQ